MHIPDGYLGPQTYGVLYAIMVPLWGLASTIVRRTLNRRQGPFLALGAAFSFLIMLFNIPIPGGSAGHSVGGVIVAILLGPWAALIVISISVVIQAPLFGDGGKRWRGELFNDLTSLGRRICRPRPGTPVPSTPIPDLYE